MGGGRETNESLSKETTPKAAQGHELDAGPCQKLDMARPEDERWT